VCAENKSASIPGRSRTCPEAISGKKEKRADTTPGTSRVQWSKAWRVGLRQIRAARFYLDEHDGFPDLIGPGGAAAILAALADA